jgi:O-antigen/teichoic acid export membrane protein
MNSSDSKITNSKKRVTTSSFLKKSVKHGAIYGIGDILHKFVGFMLIPIYTRYLTPADYGVLEVLGVTISIIGLFIIHGMYSAFSRSYLYDYKDNFEQQRELFSTTYFYLLGSGIFFFTILTVFSQSINGLIFKNDNHLLLLKLSIGICCLEAIRGFPFAIYRNNFESVKFVTLRTIGFTVNISLNIYFIVVKQFGITGILIGNLLTSLLICIIGTFLLKDYFVFRFSIAKLKPMLKFGLPLLPAGIAWFIFDISDRYFLVHLSSKTELGLYSLAAKFAMIVQFLLLMPLQRVYFASYYPLAKNDPENARYILGRFFTYFCLAGGFVGLGVIFLSEPLIKIMADKAFWASYKVVPLLAGSAVLLGIVHTLNAGINITGKTKYLPLIVGSAAIVNIGLNIALIPKFGMMGAGYATFISYIVYFLICYFVNQAIYKRNFELLRLIKIVSVTIIILVMGILYKSSAIMMEILYDCLMILLYPTLLYLFSFFTDQEKQKIVDFIKTKFLTVKKRFLA